MKSGKRRASKVYFAPGAHNSLQMLHSFSPIMSGNKQASARVLRHRNPLIPMGTSKSVTVAVSITLAK